MPNSKDNPSWFFGDLETTNTAVSNLRSAKSVEEITLSHVYLKVDKANNKIKVHLYNTDPKNWNLFMFPYDTQKIRKRIDGKEILEVMNNEVEFFEKFDLPKFGTTDSKIPTQCEIKFSQSTNRQTLYIFVYDIISPSQKQFDFDEEILTFSSAQEITEYFLVNSEKYASNVPAIVKKIWHLGAK